jgi:hypothetical protein
MDANNAKGDRAMCIVTNWAGCLSTRFALGLLLLVLAANVGGCGAKSGTLRGEVVEGKVVRQIGFFSRIEPFGSSGKIVVERNPNSFQGSHYAMRGPKDSFSIDNIMNHAMLAPGESVELVPDISIKGRENYRYTFIGYNGKYIELETTLTRKSGGIKRILVLPYNHPGED